MSEEDRSPLDEAQALEESPPSWQPGDSDRPGTPTHPRARQALDAQALAQRMRALWHDALTRAREILQGRTPTERRGADEKAPEAPATTTEWLRRLGQQLAKHPVAVGIVGAVGFLSGLISILNFLGLSNVSVFLRPARAYLDGATHLVVFLGWVALALLLALVVGLLVFA